VVHALDVDSIKLRPDGRDRCRTSRHLVCQRAHGHQLYGFQVLLVQPVIACHPACSLPYVDCLIGLTESGVLHLSSSRLAFVVVLLFCGLEPAVAQDTSLKAAQRQLIERGYRLGIADGLMGKRSGRHLPLPRPIRPSYCRPRRTHFRSHHRYRKCRRRVRRPPAHPFPVGFGGLEEGRLG
jgi:hypothetical protein